MSRSLLLLLVALPGLAAADGGVAPDGAVPGGDGGHALPPRAAPRPADEALLARLCGQPPRSLEPLRKGTTLKLKIVVTDGAIGVLRPAQRNEAGYFRADVAAYLLAQRLGLDQVPPACLRTVAREQLLAAAGELRPRFEREVTWSKDGRGAEAAVVAWVDHVASSHLAESRREWQPLLAQGRPLVGAPSLLRAAAQASELLTWDFLIANWDRWSGSNTFAVGKSGPAVWLDNAAGFGRYSPPMRRRNEGHLAGLERFSRRFVTALRAVGDEELERALRPAGLPLMAVRQLTARRATLLHHIDGLIARFGDAAVLCFD